MVGILIWLGLVYKLVQIFLSDLHILLIIRHIIANFLLRFLALTDRVGFGFRLRLNRLVLFCLLLLLLLLLQLGLVLQKLVQFLLFFS